MPRTNPGRKKARVVQALEGLKKDLARPAPPEQSGREPRDLNSYRERVKRDITHLEEKLKNMAG